MSQCVFRLALVVVLISFARPQLTTTGASNQSTKVLEITSPADGAVVNPGQTLIVTVVSPDNSTFAKVLVIAEGAIGMSDMASSLPARLSLTIPREIACRKYLLSALGVRTSGVRVSTEILIDVERPDLPRSLSVDTRQFLFAAEGESADIGLLAHFSDGTILRVTESSNVVYASSDPSVATVDANGIVTAVADGDAGVTATYGPPAAGVSVRVSVGVEPPVLTVLPRALAFGNQAIGTASSLQHD
jgi:hypothetical protein